MRKYLIISLVFLPLLFVQYVSAQDNPVFSAYRKYKEIGSLPIKTPTVVEVPFNGPLEIYNFAVWDATLNSTQPLFVRQEMPKYDITPQINTVPNVLKPSALIDRNLLTYAEFPISPNSPGYTKISWTSNQPVTSSALTTMLDNYVVLPNYIEITAVVDGQEKLVLAKRIMDQNTVHFPRTTSSSWNISYWYSQPLRISELDLIQENSGQAVFSVRFLAQPGHSYRVFFDPDRYVALTTGEAGNLSSAKDVLKLSDLPTSSNPAYRIADIDHDGVPDMKDNCISEYNPDQIDVNKNGRGDVCDDFDFDGIINSKDNCPDNPNLNQRDVDGDGIGDACDNQESRFTEKYPWIPWLGIGFAIVVLISLFAITARAKQN